jgi:hypothetical protein
LGIPIREAFRKSQTAEAHEILVNAEEHSQPNTNCCIEDQPEFKVKRHLRRAPVSVCPKESELEQQKFLVRSMQGFWRDPSEAVDGLINWPYRRGTIKTGQNSERNQL